MFIVDFDLSAFEKYAIRMGASADQVPFALSRALNDAVEAAREHLIETTWPSSGLETRNKSFIARAFSRAGLVRSTKYNLQAEIRDTLKRGNLALHAEGGTKVGRGNLAIPMVRSGNVTRNQSGSVRADQRPLRLARSFRRGNAIYQVTGRGKSRRVKLMYVLQPAAPIKKAVPFHEDFARITADVLTQQIPIRVLEAMATRRPR